MEVCYTIKDATVVTVKAMKKAIDSCWRKCIYMNDLQNGDRNNEGHHERDFRYTEKWGEECQNMNHREIQELIDTTPEELT